jgi:hypothetical protein
MRREVMVMVIVMMLVLVPLKPKNQIKHKIS